MEFFDAIANMSALSFVQHMVNGISLGSLVRIDSNRLYNGIRHFADD